MLAILAVCLLGIALGFDLLGLATGEAVYADLAIGNLAVGLGADLLAGVAAIVDLRAVALRSEAGKVALVHLTLHGGALGLLALSLGFRTMERPPLPSALAIVLTAAGLGVLGIALWLGVELRERLTIASREPEP